MATTGPALWPSSTTWPDTTVYPGQGSYPMMRALVSFDDVSVASPVCTDKTDKLRDWQVARGRATELDQFDAGSAQVEFDNRDRSLDPIINTSVRPMNRVWLYEEFSGEVHDLFKGYAESWQQTWPGGGWSDAVATVRAVDEIKVLARTTLPTTGTIPIPPTQAPGQMAIQIGFILDQVASQAPRRLTTAYETPSPTVRNMVVQSPKSEIDISV